MVVFTKFTGQKIEKRGPEKHPFPVFSGFAPKMAILA
jgi:hypothetical protein